MKLFKNTVIAMLSLAVAAGFATACSDDDDYMAGEQSPGAYFAKGLPATVNAPEQGASVEVTLNRTSTDAPTTYNLTLTDESGLFTAPTSVSFDNDKLTSTIRIAYTEGTLTEGVKYPVKLVVDNASQYGAAVYEFNITQPSPMVTEKFGVGTYTYNGCWTGTDPDLTATITYSTRTPDNVTMQILHWGSDMALTLEFTNWTTPDEDGLIYCNIPDQQVTTYSDGRPINMTSMYNYYEMNGANPAPYADECYFDTNTGLITLHAVYYIPGSTSWFGDDNWEYFQFDGYPNYDISVAYRGIFIQPNGNMSVVGVFNAGKDVAGIKALLWEGRDAEACLDALLGDDPGVVDIEPGKDVIYNFPIRKGGDYTLMAISVDAEGTPQKLDYTDFNVAIGSDDDSENWDDYGVADFADGWVMAAFSIEGVPIVVADRMFPVQIQKSKAEEGLFRMVEPYGESYLLNKNNAYPAKRNIQFVLDGRDYVEFKPQLSGFGVTNWKGELTIGNYTGYLADGNPDVDHATIAEFIISKNNEKLLSTYEDDVVTVNVPWIGAPGIGDGTFGYSWNNSQAAQLYMPVADEASSAKARAARVAKPKVVGIAGAAVARMSGKATGLRIPRQFNAGKAAPVLKLR